MRCPNRKCGRDTPRLIVQVDKAGKVYEGCDACIRVQIHRKVYTGKKIWAGSEVYGKRLEQKNYDWIEKTAARAAENRRRYPFRSVPDGE